MLAFNLQDTNSQLDLSLDAELLDNSEPTFDDSNLDLNSLDDIDPYTAPETKPKLSYEDKYNAIISYLSENPNYVINLSKGITNSNLDMLSSALDYDVEDLYSTDVNFNIFINGIAQGIITGPNFPKSIPNTLKIFYVTSDLKDSIHFRNMGSMSVYKSTPAITSISEESVNSLNSTYKTHTSAFSSLYSFLKDACYKPYVKESPMGVDILSYDNKAIATHLSKSKRGVDAGLNKLIKVGCPKVRLQKISILAKALKDI